MAEFLKLMEKWDGFKDVRRMPFSEAQIAKTLDLLTNKPGYPSHQQECLLREAITTTDFPGLFGFVIDREVLARYKVVVADWKSYFKMKTHPNFNEVEIHKVNGADERLPVVTEKGEYLVATMSEGHYGSRVYKHGKQFDISWEATVNDILDAFADIPERFANACIRSEAFQATSTHTVAAGPNPALFGAAVVDAADLGVVTNQGVLALTVANLQTTMGLMAVQQDVNGEPLSIRAKHLVVPPSLEMTARQILSSTLLLSTAAAPVPASNIIPQMGLQLHVDPYLPVVDTSGNRNGTWYLFADPAEVAAMEYGYLRGYETPEICMKASDKVSTLGAPLSAFSGDFATDNVLYRVRDVFGSVQMDPRAAYAQVSA